MHHAITYVCRPTRRATARFEPALKPLGWTKTTSLC